MVNVPPTKRGDVETCAGTSALLSMALLRGFVAGRLTKHPRICIIQEVMSTNTASKMQMITDDLRERSMMTTSELQSSGVSREYVRRMANAGRLERVARGLYRLPGADISANHSIVEAARLIPNGVVCLLSALRVHQVTTQSPFEVWVAVEGGAWRPRPASIPVRVVRPHGPAFQEGIEYLDIEGIPVRVYSLAKTVVDCFKYRNKIGLDVSLEALRESIRSKRVSVDDLWRFAKVCRVSNVIRPYLEAID